MSLEKQRINKYINKVKGWKFRFFLLLNLPLAFIARLKIKDISEKQATVTVPFSFWNKNPFNSIYFAVLSMAGELSTGMLGLMHIYKKHWNDINKYINFNYTKVVIHAC